MFLTHNNASAIVNSRTNAPMTNRTCVGVGGVASLASFNGKDGNKLHVTNHQLLLNPTINQV